MEEADLQLSLLREGREQRGADETPETGGNVDIYGFLIIRDCVSTGESFCDSEVTGGHISRRYFNTGSCSEML